MRYAVAQLVEALSYKAEGRGFDSSQLVAAVRRGCASSGDRESLSDNNR